MVLFVQEMLQVLFVELFGIMVIAKIHRVREQFQ